MKAKKIVVIISLVVILAAGLWAVIYANANISKTYDGSDIDVVELYEDPDGYVIEDPDGVADIIVLQDLDKTRAANNVAAVVFDFRGYDTLGEAFILVCAISGAFVILHVHKKKKSKEDKAE